MITGEDISLKSPDTSESQESPKEEATNSALEETVKLLEERMTMYKTAEKKATDEENVSKARRFGRGIKSLKELLSSAKSGKQIDIASIPPVLPPSATSTVTENPTGN